MQQLATLRKHLAREYGASDGFAAKVRGQVARLLYTLAAAPSGKQVKRAEALVRAAIRCVRESKAAVDCVVRADTGERTLTEGRALDVGKVMWAVPVLVGRNGFATRLMLRTRTGQDVVRLCRFGAAIHTYEETVARYPEWCGLERRVTT